jgi:serine/threonine-protein kinase
MAARLARSQRTAPRGSVPESRRSLINVGDLLAGKYRVRRLLGEGGMALVFEAHHELLDQPVAVKLLWHDIADDEAQSRLLLEARSAAKLQSDHVARVIDVDVGADGLPFIVMELLQGADLCRIVDERGALPRVAVVDYILQALEGLAHAHGRTIIHRDLKPSNLFLAERADGTQIIKIVDFGISKAPASGVDRTTYQLTGGRTVLGSPPYMSPEQVRSPKTIDHRTDIWSLGICMYELLTGKMPFGGDEMQETFAQILENQPTPIRAVVHDVPEGLERVVMKCLAKDRDDRYADVCELASALVPYGSGAWTQSPERIQSTLTRALLDDITSGTRLRSGGGPPAERVSAPAPPVLRRDSVQPELNGTASTVARGFTVFESKRRVVVGACLTLGCAGLTLIGVSYMLRGGPAVAAGPSETASVEPPAPALESSALPMAGQPAPVESEPPRPPATVTMASSPPAAPLMRARPNAPVARPASGSPNPKKSSSSTSLPGKGLPAGLPQTRSGQ